MTLQEILNEIDTYTNVVSDAQKIIWINEALGLHYKKISKTEIYTMDTVANLALYALDDSIMFEEIYYLTIEDSSGDAVEYSKRVIQNYSYGYSFYEPYEGYVGIYPVPSTTGYEIIIYYINRPSKLTSSDLSTQLDYREEYMPMIIAYVQSKVAKTGNNPDVEMANNFVSDYLSLKKKVSTDYMARKIDNPKKSKSNVWW